MKDCHIKKMVLLDTPDFTFFMKPGYDFTGYEENNDFIIELSQSYPDEFTALVTLDSRDTNKLEGIKNLYGVELVV